MFSTTYSILNLATMAPKRAKNKGKQVAFADPQDGPITAPKINAQQASVAPIGDASRALMPPPPPPEKWIPMYEPKVDVEELVKQLEKASSTEDQVKLFSDMKVQAVLRMRETGGKIRDHVKRLESDIAAAAMSNAAAKLEEQIKGFDYSDLTFMEALKHWVRSLY